MYELYFNRNYVLMRLIYDTQILVRWINSSFLLIFGWFCGFLFVFATLR